MCRTLSADYFGFICVELVMLWVLPENDLVELLFSAAMFLMDAVIALLFFTGVDSFAMFDGLPAAK